MVKTVPGQPGGSPAGLRAGRRLAGRQLAGRPGPAGQYTARERAAALIRRRHLTPYLLLLPSVVAIGALVLWPAVQIGLFSFQNYGLPQVTGAAGTDWIGAGNYTAILSDPEFWLSLRISLIFAAVVVPLTLLTVLLLWQGFPFIAVTVLAGLKTVPAELHESARVDGAGPWRIFWRVTYPLLKPIFLVLLLLSVIWDFGVFTQVYIVIGELGNRDEYNLGIYAYDRAFSNPPSYGAASALAFILTVILLIITVGYVRASVKQGAVN